MFHFAQANGNPQCYPNYPFRPDGSKRPAAGAENWPHISTCKQASLSARGWGPAMPVYYNVRNCPNTSGRGEGGSEIRVSYNLFYEKDGFKGSSANHDYDWERVIVIWRKYGLNLYKDEILVSSHKGYKRIVGWDSIPQTVDAGNWFESNGKNKDHAKVYVGWCKHAMFFEKRTKDSTIVACLDDTEMRSDDWYFVADQKSTLVSAMPGSDYFNRFRANDWGNAWSKPDRVYDSLCSQ
ncbi:hypothetical protein V8F06_012842 [Rhypophila decipiens]